MCLCRALEQVAMDRLVEIAYKKQLVIMKFFAGFLFSFAVSSLTILLFFKEANLSDDIEVFDFKIYEILLFHLNPNRQQGEAVHLKLGL